MLSYRKAPSPNEARKRAYDAEGRDGQVCRNRRRKGRAGPTSCSASSSTRRTEALRRESLLIELRQRIRDVRQGPDGLLNLLTDEDDGALLRIEPVP
jgi:glucose/arabinose dehydrogenase